MHSYSKASEPKERKHGKVVHGPEKSPLQFDVDPDGGAHAEMFLNDFLIFRTRVVFPYFCPISSKAIY